MTPATTFGAVFGAVIVRRRTAAEMSQADAAERMGLQRTSLSRLERGKALFTLPQLRRAAKALDTSVSDLFREAEAGAAVLTRKKVEVLDEVSQHGSRRELVWVSPAEVERILSTIEMMPVPSKEFWRVKTPSKETELVPQARR